MATQPYIEAKRFQILDICEKYLALEGFNRDACQFYEYSLNIPLSNQRLIIVDFVGEKKALKISPKMRPDKCEPLPETLTVPLCVELWELFRGSVSPLPTPVPAINNSIEPESPPKVYLSKKWYNSYKHLAEEPYIDISPFVKLLKEDYLQVNNHPLQIPKDKENDFDFIEQIFLKLNLL